MGDSFTEGIGDPEPASPGGHRGWADRVAEELSRGHKDFAYANLAVRGRLLQQIVDQQLAHCLSLKPDLITLSAGGNDLIRPGGDPDALAEKLDSVVQILSLGGATVVLFNGPDTGSTVLGRIRSKVAIYNENLRTIAARHDAVIADMWSLRQLNDPQMWDADRLHFSPLGHHTIAAMVLDSLNVQHTLEPLSPKPLPQRNWREARTGDLVWAQGILRPLGGPPAAAPLLGRRHHGQAAPARSGVRPRRSPGLRARARRAPRSPYGPERWSGRMSWTGYWEDTSRKAPHREQSVLLDHRSVLRGPGSAAPVPEIRPRPEQGRGTPAGTPASFRAVPRPYPAARTTSRGTATPSRTTSAAVSASPAAPGGPYRADQQYPTRPAPGPAVPGRPYPGQPGYGAPVPAPTRTAPSTSNNPPPSASPLPAAVGTRGAAAAVGARRGTGRRKLAELDQQYSNGEIAMEDYMAQRAEIMKG